MRRIVLMLVTTLALTPVVALAQTTQSTGQAMPMTQTAPPPDENEMKDGYIAFWAGKIHWKDSDSGDVGRKHRAIGFSFGFWQRGILGGEIDFGYSKDFFGNAAFIGGSNLMTITGNAIIGPWINLSDNQAIRPYFLIGGGLIRSSLSGFGSFPASSENRGVIDIGGGVHIYLLKQLGLRGDYRMMKDFGQTTGSQFGLTGLSFIRVTGAAMFCF